ncbi:MAG: DUF4433 domain-containing protein [Saprospiraceae bacterium]|nr:DUF4433 domain-containing protein [Saprospiraceae bacterium]
MQNINLYRIVHRDNVAYILEKGMFCYGHPFFDPDNIFIGDSKLTQQRHDFDIPLSDGGYLGDYVPFYLGFRSPMLYNIHTGHRGIEQRPQSDIIYIVCKLHCLIEKDYKVIFTDGHAKNKVTRFYTDIQDLNRLDWESINAQYWQNTDTNPDRMRRKQAECLVKSQVPPQCIAALVVYDEATKNEMEKLVQKSGHKIGVHINPKSQFYY